MKVLEYGSRTPGAYWEEVLIKGMIIISEPGFVIRILVTYAYGHWFVGSSGVLWT